MREFVALGCALIAAATMAAPASAGFISNQNREVWADADVNFPIRGGDGEHFVAPPDVEWHATADDFDTDFGNFASASASQDSDALTEDSISASGQAVTIATFNTFGRGEVLSEAGAHTIFEITFTLADETPYALDWEISAFQDGLGTFAQASVMLFQEFGERSGAIVEAVVQGKGDGTGQTDDGFSDGLLGPGTYTLVARAESFSDAAEFTENSINGSAWWEITFRIPTPGSMAILGLAGLLALRRRR